MRMRDGSRTDAAHVLAHRRRSAEVDRRSVPVVVARARGAERDLVAVTKRHLPANALAVHVRAVEAPEVAEDEASIALLEDAVLLRHDLVEELDGIVRMAAEAIDRPQLDRLLPLGCCEDQTRHRSSKHRTCLRGEGR